MARIPTPFRAALGLAATAVESARTLPDRALELPVLAVSTALQFSLRAQQRYAELTLRGDELLGRLQGPPEDPPPWATFDDEGSADGDRADEHATGASRADEASVGEDRAGEDPLGGDGAEGTASPEDIPIDEPAQRAAARSVKSAEKQPRKSGARSARASSGKASSATASPGKASAATASAAPASPGEASAADAGSDAATSAATSPSTTSAAKRSGAKQVRSPRQAKPSAFDQAPGGPDA